jgi:hypothetical protein
MALDPNIALGVRPIEVPNQLAQYSQLAQIQNAQNQNQVAQMQFEKMRKHEDYLTKMGEAITKNGGPDLMTAASLMAQNPDPNVQLHGIQMLTAQQELAAYRSKYNGAPNATGGYGGAPMPEQSQGLMGQAAPNGQVPNALAPQAGPARSQNALADNTDALRQELLDLSQYPNVPQAKARAAIVKNQLDEAMKTHVVPNVGLVTGAGRTIVASGAAPTDLKRLTTERDALSVNDPSRKLYDQAIADIGATNRIARERLDWEKANPGFEIKEDADGNMFGVNKRTLQAVPVTIGGVATPAAAPAAGPGMPGARAPAPAVGQPAMPMGGAPKQLQGKGQALTESQGNATAFGMRMIDSNKLLTNLEKSGTTSGGRFKGAVEGTLTSLVPYQGEKLAEGAGAIMNTLPSSMGGPSAEQQKYQQAKLNFITASLRKESGASISPSEYVNEDKKYFPQAGEPDSVIQQKQKARELAIRSMKIQAGPGAKHITTESDPLGLGL